MSDIKQRANPDAVERFNADPSIGLNAEQVRQRTAQGLINVPSARPGKSVAQIVRENLLTLFNLMNFGLAICVISVGSYKNALFMCVILANIVIGIVQEVRARHTVERLRVVNAPHAQLVRDGKTERHSVEDIVLDDIAVWDAGMQLSADCEVIDGKVEVNESALTGESEPVVRGAGETLLSGSFVVSGSCRARVIHVGDDNFSEGIAGRAREYKAPDSDIMRALNKIIRGIGIAIVPTGVALFCRMRFGLGATLQDAVERTVGAMVGMIPEGLILLTSIALSVGVIRLARRQTLVQQMYCIETLARVDTLCLDKTGTLTTGDMRVEEVAPLCGTSEADIDEAIGRYTAATPDANATALALKERWQGAKAVCGRAVPFSSARKWSAVEFDGYGAVITGAPEIVFAGDMAGIAEKVDEYAARGRRVLAVARCAALPEDDVLPPRDDIKPLALVMIGDVLRPTARDTLRYFDAQGVEICIISGDNPVTVANIAAAAGVKDADKCIDCSTIKSDDAMRDAALKYRVFGRVTPDQKRIIVGALRAAGHTVGMTGDGVNDVLALKDADCSIAMASGSDAARQVSDIVLLNSDFASLPSVVGEGRRVINNITRSAALFLTKTLFSAILALMLIMIPRHYPFMPIQLTMFSMIAIGWPSFVLAIEPNNAPVRGDFLRNVLRRALPPALTIVAGVAFWLGLSALRGWSVQQTSTMAVMYTVCVGIYSLTNICRPMTWRHALLIASCIGLFAGCIALLPGLYALAPLSRDEITLLIGAAAAALPVFIGLNALAGRIERRMLR